MKIYLVRHGETLYSTRNEFQPENARLSQKGIFQAKKLAKRLKNEGITVIYSSPLVRAWQTAKIIDHEISSMVEILDFLRELKRPSKIEGKSRDDVIREFERDLSENFYNIDWKIEDSESLRDLIARVKQTVSLLMSRHNEEPVLIVGHGIFIACLATYCLLSDKVDNKVFIDFLVSLKVDKAGISILQLKENKYFNKGKKSWRLLVWNNTEHLRED